MTWFNKNLKCCNWCLSTVWSPCLNSCIKLSLVICYMRFCVYFFTFGQSCLCFIYSYAWCDLDHVHLPPMNFLTRLTHDTIYLDPVSLMICKLCKIPLTDFCLVWHLDAQTPLCKPKICSWKTTDIHKFCTRILEV